MSGWALLSNTKYMLQMLGVSKIVFYVMLNKAAFIWLKIL